ncbi:cytochrome P450 family protein [Nocardia cyriacigeorgica]|uniref:cytochrome P450 family protein n=1 Tax=Nocardia cyriacigeorgica TaxID=135487 RepID=UPI002456D0EA|nr:cytochrome P450 [Nocardia cyriacigeorgica]BDT87000.1 cytochrome P450 hydroxylase [Nocardia cyriacigeorgica]BDU06491.1 cytochrome P450 hydroxylase [Nocardia cyriacigeorgica]
MPVTPRPIVVDLLSDDFHARAHTVYDELRARAPIVFAELPEQPGRGFWMITGYAAAEAALRDRRLANNPRALLSPAQLAARTRAGITEPPNTMLLSDPPEHTRLRRVAQQAFTPRSVTALRPAMIRHAERLLDDAEQVAGDGDGTVDLLHAYAYPLSLAVLGDILGFPEEWHPGLRDLAVRAATAATPLSGPDPVLRDRLDAYTRELVVRKRRTPGDDLVSRLAHPESGREALSDPELQAMVGLLVAAGFETSAGLIASAVLSLLTHPDQWAALRADPSLAAAAVEETMRYWGPVESATMRLALSTLELGGQRIERGDRVLVFTAAANRDPAHVPDPHRFDIHRAPRPHLGFSGGIHNCLGAALARTEVAIALTTLVARWPGLRPADGATDPSWRPGMGLRGLRALPVRP